MDAGIADTINREDARTLTAYLDAELNGRWHTPWWNAPIADTLMSDDEATRSDRAWLVGILAFGVEGVRFDGGPADEDWDNLFSHFRAEILARRVRDPKTPPAPEAEIRLGCVV